MYLTVYNPISRSNLMHAEVSSEDEALAILERRHPGWVEVRNEFPTDDAALNEKCPGLLVQGGAAGRQGRDLLWAVTEGPGHPDWDLFVTYA